MLLLCSNGLTGDRLKDCIIKMKKGKAAIVVTADNEYKGNHYHVPRYIEKLRSLGFSADIYDIDYQEVSELLNYDAVEFIGGNPYYLLNSLRNKNAKDVLYKIAVDKILIGWSADTLVMGPSISIIEKYIPEMNTYKNLNLTGLCLTYIQILPHYSGPVKKYSNCEKLCHEYECSNKCFVIRISDGEEALINMVDKKVTIIKG